MNGRHSVNGTRYGGAGDSRTFRDFLYVHYSITFTGCPSMQTRNAVSVKPEQLLREPGIVQ